MKTETDLISDDGGFDEMFIHYFPKKEGEIIQQGDVALCGIAAKTTRNAKPNELDMDRCPICLALLETTS